MILELDRTKRGGETIMKKKLHKPRLCFGGPFVNTGKGVLPVVEECKGCDDKPTCAEVRNYMVRLCDEGYIVTPPTFFNNYPRKGVEE